MIRHRIRKEDIDVEMFPCSVRSCGEHAEGWADRLLLELMRVELDVDPDLDRVYLCAEHISPIKPGGVNAPL
jgi:hypothetical protein